MSFVLSEERRVFWPVIINEPVDGGKVQRRKIELQFRIVDCDDWDESGESILDALMNNITGWKGIELQDRTPVEFSDEALMSLLKLPYARTAIWNTYIGEVLPGSSSKN